VLRWRRVLANKHEVPLVKKAAMKAAGAVLSRPAAYRAAVASAETALAHLPRFVIYNGLNAWVKHREVPHPTSKRSTAGIRRIEERGHEQPRRHPCFDPSQSATLGPAAASRAPL
jgi:hypothetical protein